MEIILVGFIMSLVVSAGALTYSLVKAERWSVTTRARHLTTPIPVLD